MNAPVHNPPDHAPEHAPSHAPSHQPTNPPAYRQNGQPISAEAFYAIACDPRRHVAVEACAGAGKTWMLVSRIVRALLDNSVASSSVVGGVTVGATVGVQPQDILAITFTKKAAGEMRERLSDWLTDFERLSPEALRQELRLRGVTDESFERKIQGISSPPFGMSVFISSLQQLKQTVQQNGRSVQIRTFHSWFASLLKTAPLALLHDLSLPSVYTLIEDESQAVAEVWPAFFERVVATPELRADFDATVQTHGRTQTLLALTHALGRRVEFGLADAHGVLARSVKAFGDEFTDFAGLAHPDEALAPGGVYRRAVDEAAVNLAQASAPTFAQKGVDLQTALAKGDVDAALNAMLTRGDAGGRTARKFGKKLPQPETVAATQDFFLRLLGARQQFDAHLHQQRMSRLTRVLVAEYAALKRARGWIDMPDIERAAHAMLSHPTLSGWVQQRLDARVRHLLIDEFQDTSPLQWQALSSWLAGYGGAGGDQGPRVFIVGDPKQSIYRFRRAEPQVFLAALAFVRDGLGGDVLSCDHTRRNATSVISVVNQAMQSAQTVGDYADFRAHTTASNQTGGVWRLPAIPSDAVDAARGRTGGESGADEAGTGPDAWRDSLTTPRYEAEETRQNLECRQLAQWLHSLLHPATSTSATATSAITTTNSPSSPAAEPLGGLTSLRPQHIMVLSRKRKRLSLLEAELRRLHIPALQPENNQLGDAPEVKDIIALLDAVLSPGNDLALAQALKSPIFGCTDEDLIHLALLRRAQKADARSSWLSLLSSAHEDFPDAVAHDAPPRQDTARQDTARQDTANWPAIAAQLAAWQARLASVPPHDALHTIFEDADLIARFAAAAPAASRSRVIANLQALLAAALDFDGGRYATPYAFVRAVKAGRIKAPASTYPDAVQLLTVHGAKGLEAPLVVLLDTDGSAPKRPTHSVLIDWPGEAPAPTRFSFLASETRPPRCNADALASEVRARQREELNGLYVAMTRARHTLVLSSNTPKRSEALSWWTRLHDLAAPLTLHETVGEGLVSSVDDTSGSIKTFTLDTLPFRHVPVQLFAPEIKMIQSVESTYSLDSLDSRIGQAMHWLLECLALDDTPPFWSPAHIAVAAHRFDLDATQAAQAADMAQRLRSGAGAWAWHASALTWHGNEVPLTVQAKLLRLDRLVQRQDDASWWVLDYKSATHPLAHPDYVAQLQSYRAALQKLLPGQTVHAAFLTPQGQQFELP